MNAPVTTMTAAQMIEKYLALRDKVTAIKKQHTEQLAPYNVAMAKLEALLLDHLNQQGADNIKVRDVGTAYKVTNTSATVAEWPLVLDYVRQHEAWDLLQRAVSKTAVLAAIEETQAPVPGVKVSQETVLNVRRG